VKYYEYFLNEKFKKAHIRQWYEENDVIEGSFPNFYNKYIKWRKRMRMRLIKEQICTTMNTTKAKKIKKELSPLIKRDADMNLPISRASKPIDYILPITDDNILFLTDIHVPFHDIDALKAAIQFGLDKGVNTIWLNGDIVDMYAISKYDKDPRKRDFGDEIMSVRMFLESLRNIFPKANIYYKEGNHEQRWVKYILKNLPDLLALGEFDLASILKLNDYRVHFVANERLAYAGDLLMIHGNEIRLSGNIAEKLYRKTYSKAICGHHHQTWNFSEPNIKREFIHTYAVGCLSELFPEYMIYNRHNHGFAHITISNGVANVNNIRYEG